MVKKVIWSVLFMLIAALLQSTILSRLEIYIHAIPDIALCILVYSAYVNGAMTGQFSGFFSGAFLDFLSAAPLGLNSLIRTLIGGLTGFMKGTFYLDPFFLPMALCAGATILKAVIYYLLHLLFTGGIPSYSLFELTFWIELCMNTLLAPPLFTLLKLFQPLLSGSREDT